METRRLRQRRRTEGLLGTMETKNWDIDGGLVNRVIPEASNCPVERGPTTHVDGHRGGPRVVLGKQADEAGIESAAEGIITCRCYSRWRGCLEEVQQARLVSTKGRPA